MLSASYLEPEETNVGFEKFKNTVIPFEVHSCS
jgi:hypothetical protein